MISTTIRTIARADIGLIEPLWDELKAHHQQRTASFDAYYLQIGFQKRKAELLSKDQLLILVAGDIGCELGFCVASVNNGAGEVESLYVRPQSRHQRVGSTLMQHALAWLSTQNSAPIRLLIGEGNEAVIAYYHKLGFRKRATMMELCK
ncbi:MAG: GNAT family N-acetyltransferase [Gammaproteobacteria bacterium]|nr:GNAT family N-acetyltransferase [Gammaproteobacteria bacterium]